MAKKIFFTILILISFGLLQQNKLLCNNADYVSGVIIIKFKSNSEIYRSWLKSNRNAPLTQLNFILGKNTTRPFIQNNLLKALAKHLKPNNLFWYQKNAQVENLRRICLVKYSNPIDPQIASNKIYDMPYVEYAEPLPQEHLEFIPNDSLLDDQYYLNKIKVFDAWDSIKVDSNIVIGIVDTGVDYNHEDLKDKIWVNLGESGNDKNGNDKRTNGIDDDDNGFIDDWRGWDFVSSENPAVGDNDPHPGHIHGTHVAGVTAAMTNNKIGIAGIARGAKILPVKIGDDNPFSTSVSNSYEGILYAATMGADVINCSWGSESRSEAEMEVLSTATSLGSLIIAAAGNNGDYTPFFPASHKDVVSVAAVNIDDIKAGFSNYHPTVDISAPGVDILSSIPGNSYEYLDGTSMASPVVTGVAALVKSRFPDYSPMQLKEQLKASSDNIDTLNPYFIGQIGRGRIDAFKAIGRDSLKSIVLDNYRVIDENGNNIYEKNEKIELYLSFLNALAHLNNMNIEVSVLSTYQPQFINKKADIGAMNTLEIDSISEPIKFIVPNDIPADYNLELEILIYDGKEYINSEFVNLIFNPSYRTMDANNLSVTFNARGNIAYNDYPANFQGQGFRYKKSSNLLYEGALMIALPPDKVSDVARGEEQSTQDNSFYSKGTFNILNPGAIANEEGSAKFYSDSGEINISTSINQKVYQFDDEQNKDFIIITYDIANNSLQNYDSLFVGLYFDWDIGPSGNNNIANFNNEYGFGYVKNIANDTLPFVGASLISNQKLNYFAIDNDGVTADNPGVWDGFSRFEKYFMLSSGVFRKKSNITDVSFVIGGGPIKINIGDTARVAFSLFAGDNIHNLIENSEKSREIAKYYNIADGKYNPLPKLDSLITVYPNPAKDLINVDFMMVEGSYLIIDIYNTLGKKVKTMIENRYYTAGYHSENFKLDNLAQGRYFLWISTTNTRLIEPFEIYR